MPPASKPIVPACMAAASSLAQADGAQAWLTTPNSKLESMRGGFRPMQGLWVSFGIERTVRIDGQLVMQSSLNIPNLANIDPAQLQQLSQQISTLGIVQSGSGNSAKGTQVTLAPGVVIQNTQSNRHLQSMTEINAATNGMRLLQGLNFGQAINDALQGSLGR